VPQALAMLLLVTDDFSGESNQSVSGQPGEQLACLCNRQIGMTL
jgi:hypothetical protein